MVNIIASRAAAYRLSWIIAALMVPIFFFGFFMEKTLFEEAQSAHREQDGAALINLLIPIYVGAAGDKIETADISALATLGPKFAQNLDVNPALDELIKTLKNPERDYSAVLVAARELASDTIDNSKIVLDTKAETYYLATTVGVGFPSLVDLFKTLQKGTMRYLVNSASSAEILAPVLLAVSNLDLTSAQTINNIHKAFQNSDHSEIYKPLFEAGDAIEQRISRHSKNISIYFARHDGLANRTLLEVAQDAMPILAEYRNAWGQANARFSLLLEQRANEIQRRIIANIFIGAASVIVGLGLALAMFRSTLKRLDDVELAHHQAEDARNEAVALANSISTINEDVVRMNHELSANMKKLKSAQDELVKKGRLEQMGQLTATIAHELRNPLGAVRTSAFLIERKIKDKGLGVEPQLARINNGITRCDNIITQLLDFSRTKKLAARADDLDQWLAKTIEEEAKSLPAAVEIHCNLGMNGLLVPFDPSRLQRAIINLVSNASEAMVGNGEDASRFAVANPIITICSEVVGEYARISISDNGPGISPENISKIREPLFTTKSFGTGLGIPAVEQIATQHGGTLEVTSVLGQGATFTIKIPIAGTIEVAA